MFVHPLATIDETVEIGQGTRIWQYASVIRGARIGIKCNVASGATIDGSHWGNHSICGHNVAMGPGFLIGDYVFIAPNCTLCNDAWPRARKDGWDIDAFKERYAIIIKNGASIGSNSVVGAGVTIGENAMIAAGSVVNQDVPDNHFFKRDGTIVAITHEPRRIKYAKAQDRNFILGSE